MSLEAALRSGLHALGMVFSDAQVGQLLEFAALLQKWNKVYNLTALRSADEVLTHHLLDSLAAVPPLQRHMASMEGAGKGARLLDVGSGGGLPAVVFAIGCPQLDVTCVDTVAKKVAFVQQVAASLRLPNLHARHARVESLADAFDVVSCRAFASLQDFTAWSRNALAPQGVWLAMKARHPQEEIDALPPEVQVFHVEPLTVPGLQAERCIVWMRQRGQ